MIVWDHEPECALKVKLIIVQIFLPEDYDGKESKTFRLGVAKICWLAKTDTPNIIHILHSPRPTQKY